MGTYHRVQLPKLRPPHFPSLYLLKLEINYTLGGTPFPPTGSIYLVQWKVGTIRCAHRVDPPYLPDFTFVLRLPPYPILERHASLLLDWRSMLLGGAIWEALSLRPVLPLLSRWSRRVETNSLGGDIGRILLQSI